MLSSDDRRRISIMNTESALRHRVIRKRRMYKVKRGEKSEFLWLCEGCGENLYRTAAYALKAYKHCMLYGVIKTQKDFDKQY